MTRPECFILFDIKYSLVTLPALGASFFSAGFSEMGKMLMLNEIIRDNIYAIMLCYIEGFLTAQSSRVDQIICDLFGGLFCPM